ncbi:quinol:electron acceptor oxidoreductase subunit ActD [Blastopirellula marina]|uniref:Cytochrome c domain-containing protein n=1 Tax=Blastopirellula marina DSM 3645 TaxID=314230 RepID=A4A0N2_9BACT|nr:quinol:electron acceptor oxidoreductase subunit ActD [Blastopirellula marina]EAQ77698.1 hypothetical protein DSM3645_01986 [Blastopirellula marina DSM 3645]
MSKNKDKTRPQTLGLLVEFDDQDVLLKACEAVRDAGLTKTDAHVPFPVHGIDEALGIRKTILPWIVLAMGLTGGISGLAMQYVLNATEQPGALFSGYPYMISGKPTFSLPANIPVTFELTILLAAFGAFFGMLILNQLPTFSNPLFRHPNFARATNDRFFLVLNAADPKFKLHKHREMLEAFSPLAIDEIEADPSSHQIPTIYKYVAIVFLSLLTVPPMLVWNARNTTSPLPRLHPILDMDDQVKAKTQTTSPIFADGRAMRPRVPGSVARGEWQPLEFLTGIVPAPEDMSEVAMLLQEEDPDEPAADEAKPAEDKPAEEKPAAEKPAAEKPADGAAADEAAPAEDLPPEPDWVTQFPETLQINSTLVERGQQRFNIYCAVCHGLAGDGNGLVSIRAFEMQQPTWVQPTNLHDPNVVKQPVGRVFNTITNGIRKMPGYAAQINPEDRWAIVLYLKALQKSRDASIQDVPQIEADALKGQGN